MAAQRLVSAFALPKQVRETAGDVVSAIWSLGGVMNDIGRKGVLVASDRSDGNFVSKALVV